MLCSNDWLGGSPRVDVVWDVTGMYCSPPTNKLRANSSCPISGERHKVAQLLRRSRQGLSTFQESLWSLWSEGSSCLARQDSRVKTS